MGLATAIDHRTSAYQYALLYRDWGLSVFPVHRKRPVIRAWTSRTVRDGPDAGKKRRLWLTGWKEFQTSRPSEGVIHQMFSPENAGRIDGLAVVLGPVSGGLCVRDFDDPAGYRAWAAVHPHLADRLPTARTGRGVHVYFRLRPGRTAYRRWTCGATKGELLGDGRHYVVLPPSRHPWGHTYRWLNEPASVEDFPALTPEEAGFLPKHDLKTNPGSPPDAPRELERDYKTSSVKPPLHAGEQGVSEAVMRCAPGGPGERNDCLWSLARTLKRFPHLADATAPDLRPHFDQWYEAAKRVINTNSKEVCWRDFRRQWELVRVPLGVGFDAAMAAAFARPLPPEADRYTDPAVRRLVAGCVALQDYAGDGAFFLSCRTAQRVCGFGTHVTAWNWLNRLVGDRLLAVVDRGVRSTVRRRATRYRWLGSG